MPDRPDILFFFSDQHSGSCVGFAGNAEVRTTNLDRLAADGAACTAAYTSCPLCVPARSSMLTGQLTSRVGVFNNANTFPSDQATFLHALAAAGYETILCGRMHFVGADQRHGFAKRIGPDITPCVQGGQLGAGPLLGQAFGMPGCVNLAGAGRSPVSAYDEMIVATALDYLKQEHPSPQCIVVGTYGPHFPYIAPKPYFEYYKTRVTAPASWQPEGTDENPLTDAKRERRRRNTLTGEVEPVTTEHMLNMRAAYFGMIEEQDRLVGQARQAWGEYLERRGREGIFAYSSDHGDTCGEHGIFGKQTFYEGSVRIPMIFEGCGILPGHRLEGPVSIMDIGPTLCALAGTHPPPEQDGQDLSAALRQGCPQPDRSVLSEWCQWFDDRPVAGRMLRSGNWKLIHYDHQRIPDQLFDLTADSDERQSLAADRPELLRELTGRMTQDWNPKRIGQWFAEKAAHLQMIQQAVRHGGPPPQDPEKWVIPEYLKHLPELCC